MYFDYIGNKVYAIDGTNYNCILNKVDIHTGEYIRFQYSNVYDFYIRTKEEKKYYGGPGSDDDSIVSLGDITGRYNPDFEDIKRKVKNDICTDYCKNQKIKINLVGWSRGAVIAQEVARLLHIENCCCKNKKRNLYASIF